MSSRRTEVLSILLLLGLFAGCSGNSKPGTDAGVVRSPEATACVEAQREWVLEHVPAEQRQDVEATVRALLQEPGGLSSMPNCSGQ